MTSCAQLSRSSRLYIRGRLMEKMRQSWPPGMPLIGGAMSKAAWISVPRCKASASPHAGAGGAGEHPSPHHCPSWTDLKIFEPLRLPPGVCNRALIHVGREDTARGLSASSLLEGGADRPQAQPLIAGPAMSSKAKSSSGLFPAPPP